jgi:glyoxylase-like metal-dependent hydrolase (beta-lactamase superfamily II)
MTASLPPGITVLERGWLSSNMVVASGTMAVSVVDSGYCTHSAQTLELVAATAGTLPVTRLVNTHLHSDHCGGNAALQARYPGLETLIPPGEAAAVRDWDVESLSYAATGQQCPRFRFDATLEPGGSIRLGDLRWQVHAAPGHDPHSVILFEPESRALISADALWQRGFGVVFPELEGARAFDAVAATLDVIETLQPAVVVPGHGAVFFDVAEPLDYARRRLAGFRADPARHAAHAAKVLLKFKLLELQRVPLAPFLEWAENTPCFRSVQERFFAGRSLRSWANDLLVDLQRSGAARLDDGFVINT